MSAPYNLDIGLQKLISGSTSVPVYKSQFLPSEDLKATPNGYVFWDAPDIEPLVSSEGFASPSGNESITFSLDVACVAYDNAKRKALATSVLNVLQPTVSGRRTFLTSYNVAGTGVFIQYLRMTATNESGILKTGQANPDLMMLVLSFTGKATC